MQTERKIIEIDEARCDGCGRCIPSCAEGALQLVDGKAKVISDNLCDGLGACIGECPQGALKIIRRAADEFDESAVEEHLKTQETSNQAEEPVTLACGCPSQQIQTLNPAARPTPAGKPDRSASALSHWPIQIRLVPANASFLKNARLLVVADCAAVAYPGLHQDLLAGKAIMMGCPKFDETDAYLLKFTDVFKKAGIRDVTIVTMEVPCCSGLPLIVKKGMERAGINVPIKEIVINPRGEVIMEVKSRAPDRGSAG